MKKILLLAFTASVMLGACKKDNNEEQVKLPTCATENYKETGEAWSLSVKFDEQGRITEGGDYTYNYSANSIVVTDHYDNGITTHTLDGQGRITTTVDGNETTTYEYNNEGYMIKRIATSNGTTYTETYTWSSGNLVTTVSSSSYGDSRTETITYGNDVITDKLVAGGIFREVYSYDEYLHDYFGKKPKNAPSKLKDEGDSWTQTDTYTYTKDSKGNIIGYKQTSDGSTPWSWEYNVDYNCK